MTVTDLVGAADLERIDADRQRHLAAADFYEARADEERQRADFSSVAREWMAYRAGRPWAKVRAELEAEAADIRAELAEAEEDYRDHVGYLRIMRRQEAKLRAELEAERAAATEATGR